MPTINKPKRNSGCKYKKQKKQGYIQKLYNNSKWVKLRNAHLMQNPLCANCEKLGKVTLATEVHHKHIISDGKNELEMETLAYDPNNLMSVCHECHQAMHTYARKHKINYIDFIKIIQRNFE